MGESFHHLRNELSQPILTSWGTLFSDRVSFVRSSQWVIWKLFLYLCYHMTTLILLAVPTTISKHAYSTVPVTIHCQMRPLYLPRSYTHLLGGLIEKFKLSRKFTDEISCLTMFIASSCCFSIVIFLLPCLNVHPWYFNWPTGKMAACYPFYPGLKYISVLKYLLFNQKIFEQLS